MPGVIDPQNAIHPGAFFNLCSKLWIPSKRLGNCRLIPLATQVYLIEEIVNGLNEGIHRFVVLKCRQAMITTITLAFLIYWMMRHPGMSGGFAIDDNDKRMAMNYLFRQMIHSLDPNDPQFYVPLELERREMVAFKNGSKLHFENANKREKGTLFRSIGLNLFHGSEVGYWNDEDGLLSLMSALDQDYPNRLYVFESTAHGFNLFRKMCLKAAEASSARFIFIGWWRHPWYRIEQNDQLDRFNKYWDGQLNGEEEEWVSFVKEKYDFDIVPEQIAWWRWMLDEEFQDNLQALYQDHPPTPDHAFQYGGNVFFNPEILRKTTMELEKPSNTYKPAYFRLRFGNGLLDTEFESMVGRQGYYHLAIWDAPRAGEGVQYSIGVDPAFGMTDHSDYSSIQVLRCYADGLEQVAEFAMRGISTKQLAFAVLYLFAAYHISEDFDNVMWNTELQGGGAAVINEIEAIQQDVGGLYDKLGRHFDSLRGYTYKRVDALTPGYSAKHWQTNRRNKDQFLHLIKSMFETGSLIIRSPDLIREMAIMLRSPDGYIESSDGKHEDLVMSLGVALMNYQDHIRYDLGDTDFTLARGLKTRELLIRGANADDLVSMRLFEWVRERRDRQADREEQLRDALSEFQDGTR